VHLRVSVIATVLNEASSLPRLLDSLCVQTRQPDEVIISDGGSTDGTAEILTAYAGRLPLRIIPLPGSNISQGRNAAIAAATGEVIASTDAGVRLSPNWLAALVVPFEREEQERADLDDLRGVAGGQYDVPWQVEPLRVVAGFFEADPQGAFETALGATTLPDLEDVDPLRFLPSSRSLAFRKSLWEEVGGYPEWLDYCEDLIFDFRMRERVTPEGWAFEPNAVAHFRPRPNPLSFFRQYYRYARGDGKADLWRKRHAIRYGAYLLFLPLMVLLGLCRTRWSWGVLLGAAAGYCFTPYRRLWPRLGSLRPTARLQAILYVPLIRAVGDFAKMLGYPVGVCWRLRHRLDRGAESEGRTGAGTAVPRQADW